MRSLVLVLAVTAVSAVAFADLDHAQKGQWAAYSMANDMRMKQSIANVNGKKVTIKNEMWIKGQPLPSNETTVDTEKKESSKSDPNAKVEDETLEINGHKLKCKVHTSGNVKTWICDDVPITGIVRQTLDGKITMDLTGYGNAPDEDRLKKS